MVNIHYIRQKDPKDLGHAIYCTKSFFGNESFVVLLGDDIVYAYNFEGRRYDVGDKQGFLEATVELH
jgi:UTP--glucose-1-phosphate uridylyltransferase